MAGSGTEVARAYVTIIPKSDGTSDKVVKSIVDPLSAGGNDAGAKAGGAFEGAFGAGIKKAGAALGALGLAAGVADFTKASVEAGMQFDSAMSQVAATMGKTNEQLNSEIVSVGDFTGTLRDFAQEMGASTAFSASQAADALNYMALAGYDAETSVSMLPNVLNLAAAGGIDLAYASDMVTDTQSALGLTLDETTQLVDKMAKASSKSNTSVSQLGEALLTVGGTAKNLAGGTTEASTALGILADNGIKGSEGGTALRNVILSLSAPTSKAASAIEGLGLEVFDAEGNMRSLEDIFLDMNTAMEGMSQGDKTQVLNEIFNKVDLKSVSALMATNVDRWEELSSAIDGAWYSTDSLTASLSDAGLNLEAMRGNLEAVGVTGEEFDEMLNRSGGDADAFADFLLDVADDGTTFEEVASALGGDLESLGMAFSNTTGAAQAMADTQLDNLQGDITLMQSALEGLQIKISEAVTPALRGIVQVGAETLSGLTGVIGDFMSGMTAGIDMEGFASAFKSVGDAVSQAMGSGPQADVEGFGSTVGSVVNGLIPIIQGAAPTIGQLASLVTSAVEAVSGVVQSSAPVIMSTIGKVGSFVSGAVMPIAASVTSVVVPALNRVMAVASSVISAVSGAFAQIQAAWLDVLSPVFADIGSAASSAFDALGAALGEVQGLFGEVCAAIFGDAEETFPGIGEIVSGVTEAIKTVVPPAWEAVKTVVTTVMGAVKGVVEAVWPVVKDIVIGAVEGVKGAIEGISGIVGGVIATFNAIKDAITGPIETARDVIGGIVETIKGFFSNFHIELPHIKLPHFAISPTGWQVGDLLQGKIPTLSVEWYAKGGFVDGATLIGAGERGPEMILPRTGAMMDAFASAVAAKSVSGVTVNLYYTDASADSVKMARELTRSLETYMNL